jgi:hypothetical protein
MRTLTDHKVNGLNEALEITVKDPPGHGGASHFYEIQLIVDGKEKDTWPIHFQNGPIKETGLNGLTQEALLAVVIDRLRSFQAGQFASRENALALTHIETAMLWLQKRTRDRIERGVE